MNNENQPKDREIGTDSLTRIFANDTPGQHDTAVATIKRIVREKKHAQGTV